MKTPAQPQFPPSFATDESLQDDLQFLFEAEGFDTIYDEIEMEWQEALEGKLEPLKESVRLLVEVVLDDQRFQKEKEGKGDDGKGSFERHFFFSHNTTSIAEAHRREAFFLELDDPDLAYQNLLISLQFDPFDTLTLKQIVTLLDDHPSYSSEPFLDVYDDLLDDNKKNREALATLCRSFINVIWYLDKIRSEQNYTGLNGFFSQMEMLFSRYWSRAEILHYGDLDLPQDEKIKYLLDFAHLSFDIGDYDTAHAKYKLAVVEDPENIDALRGMAHIYIQKELHSEALEWYKKILEQDPSDTEARYMIRKYLKQTFFSKITDFRW